MRLEFSARLRQGDFVLDASFTAEGERVGLFGPSGSGKSTVVRLLSGLSDPDEGRIALDGTVLFDRSRGVSLAPEKRRVAVVFQDGRLFPHMDVVENLRYGYRRCPEGERRIPFDAVVSALELSPLLGRGTANLSGGERQRVSLGRALLASPRLLLLDEPLSAMDDPLRYRIIPYLRKSFDAFSVPTVHISHSTVEMRLMAERVVVLSGGRVTGEETADELAVRHMGSGGAPFVNLLRLSGPRERNGLSVYRWGGTELVIAGGERNGEKVFELSSRDIILFRKHPEAISARNLLTCTVSAVRDLGGVRCGVELSVGGERLVAEVMAETARELSLSPGLPLFAAVKASAFREIL